MVAPDADVGADEAPMAEMCEDVGRLEDGAAHEDVSDDAGVGGVRVVLGACGFVVVGVDDVDDWNE